MAQPHTVPEAAPASPQEELLAFLGRYPQLSKEETAEIAELMVVRSYPKGTVLLKEGDISRECYFILRGCIRQYRLIDGVEKTVQFYTEDGAIALFGSYPDSASADCFLSCLENVTAIVGAVDTELGMYRKFPKLEQITRTMMEQDFGKMQKDFADFISSTPVERYKSLLRNRPDLLQRVPQHQLASYLGVTPESLSRIRKRIQQSARRT